MKKTDIALLIIIVSISALVAYLGANAVLGDPKEQSEEISVMPVAISTDITPPDPNVFYEGAINPSVRIEIDGEQSGVEGNILEEITE